MEQIKQRKAPIIALVVIVVIIGAWFYFHKQAPRIEVFDSNAAIHQMEANDRKVPVTEYVTRNISGLSAEAGFPEVLGGTFHVTHIQGANGTGTVSYEDGHNAYTAEFTYTTDKNGLVSVKTFTVKK